MRHEKSVRYTLSLVLICLLVGSGEKSQAATIINAGTQNLIPIIPETVDLAADTEDTLHYIAKQFLENKYGGKKMVITGFRDELFRTHYPSKKQSATCDVSFNIEQLKPARIKLIYIKKSKGWEIASVLQPNQLYSAHPILIEKSTPLRQISIAIDLAAAKTAEIDISRRYPGEAIFSESISSEFNHESGIAVSNIRFMTKKTMDKIELRYLLRLDESTWRVTKELSDNDKVDFRTGEIRR